MTTKKDIRNIVRVLIRITNKKQDQKVLALNPYLFVYSHPTTCVRCHNIVQMSHPRKADLETGYWTCPSCNHQYLFKHWRLRSIRLPRAGKKEDGVPVTFDKPFDTKEVGKLQ